MKRTLSRERKHLVEFRRSIARDNALYDDRGGLLIGQPSILVARTRAKIKQLSGSEFEVGKVVRPTAQYLFNTRFFRGLATTDFVVFRAATYEISRVDNVEFRDIEYDVYAEECSLTGPQFGTGKC